MLTKLDAKLVFFRKKDNFYDMIGLVKIVLHNKGIFFFAGGYGYNDMTLNYLGMGE